MTNVTLNQIETLLKEQEARLEKKFATKKDLTLMEKRLENNVVRRIRKAIENTETHIIGMTDKRKADKHVVQDLERRIEKLEQPVLS